MDAIQDRAVFSYAYRKSCWLKFRDQLSWLITCWCQPCCPCKSRKLKKDERLFKSGLSKLFTEIDLLEVVKQLRVSRFMSSLYLGQSQRELVKFLKVYSLNRPRKTRTLTRASRRPYASQTSDNLSLQSEEIVHPAEDALVNFQPDKNRVDKVLYDGIVDDLPPTKASVAPRFTTRAGPGPDDFRELLAANDDELLDDGSDGDSSDEYGEEDEDYTTGGKRGFQTNIDDFLMAFGATLDAGLEHRLTRGTRGGRVPIRGPLLNQGDDKSLGNADQQEEYTIRESGMGGSSYIDPSRLATGGRVLAQSVKHDNESTDIIDIQQQDQQNRSNALLHNRTELASNLNPSDDKGELSED